MEITTLKYRVKDSNSRKKLQEMKYSVDFVWNCCNEISKEYTVKRNKWLSGFDLQKLTNGCAKELGLNSVTVQAICEDYATRRKQFKKVKLNWRSRKKSLGWIPFKSNSIKYISEGLIKYNGNYFSFGKVALLVKYVQALLIKMLRVIGT